MKRIYFLAALLLVVALIIIMADRSAIYAQTKGAGLEKVLVGLRKAGPGDIDVSKPMMLGGSVSIYNEEGKRVEESQVPLMMSSGNFMPEPYIDDKKEVKAIVLRRATEEEKARLSEMMGQAKMKSDLIGKEAMPFSVTDVKGNNYSLEKLKGKVIVMNFWFIECPPCIMEMPELNKLVDKYKGKDVVFLGFSMNDKNGIDDFVKKKEFRYALVPDSKGVAQSYKVNVFPTHVLIDGASIVQHVMIGGHPDSLKDMDDRIGRLLGE